MHPLASLTLIVALVLPLTTAAQTVRYVDADAAPGGDGTSWASAYDILELALDDLAAEEVWVAEGTYTPAGGGRDDSFFVSGGTMLLGGFGAFEVAASERDPDLHPTILPGDFLGNDAPGFAGDSENARHVVRVASATSVTIDGFSITGGNADVDGSLLTGGAGLLIENSGVDVIDCRFVTNSCGLGIPDVGGFGGAIYAESATLTISGSLFEQNRGTNGGALGVRSVVGSTTVDVDGCQFIANQAPFGSGGAVWSVGDAVTFTQSTFTSNVAQRGGGIVGYGTGSFAVDRCTFTQNDGIEGGGGIYRSVTSGVAVSPPIVTDSRFIENTAGQTGGAGLIAESVALVVDGCEFIGNSTPLGSGGGVSMSRIFGSAGVLTMDRCLLAGNEATLGGGIAFSLGSGATITTTTLADNTADLGAGLGGSVTNANLRDSILWHNEVGGVTDEAAQIAVPISVDYSCVEGWTGALGGVGNFGLDPLFVSGVGGAYALSQTAAGELVDSPCVDSGDPASPLPLGSTRSDGAPDVGVIDRGYHFVDLGAPTPSAFVRGDVNVDGAVDISDPIATLSDLFGISGATLACDDAADANDDGTVDIADAVATLGALFVPGDPPLPAPQFCGADPTPDAIDCAMPRCDS